MATQSNAVPSPWEHLQNVLMLIFNREVRKEFKDVSAENDIGSARASLKTACTILDNDTAMMCIIRMMLFYFTVRRARDMQGAIYGIPKLNFDESVKYHPQVRLYFNQRGDTVTPEYSRVQGEIEFRVMGATNETMTEAKARQLAIKIKTEFTDGTGDGAKGYKWDKGSTNYQYLDKQLGYDLRLLCINEAMARQLIERVLRIQNHSPDWNNLIVHDPKRQSSKTSKTRRIYGKLRKLPRYRPQETVYFRYAELKIHGLNDDITLVDLTDRRIPLVKV